ncbi:unnamed protein product [Ectocarpus sp. 13 AM-2016]
MYHPAHGINVRVVSWHKTVGQGKYGAKKKAGKILK